MSQIDIKYCGIDETITIDDDLIMVGNQIFPAESSRVVIKKGRNYTGEKFVDRWLGHSWIGLYDDEIKMRGFILPDKIVEKIDTAIPDHVKRVRE